MRQANLETWFSYALCKSHRLQRTTLECTSIQYQGCVGIEHIALGAIYIIGREVLGQKVLIGNPPIFGNSSQRTPASMRDSKCDGYVECSAIDTGLSAGDNSV